MPDDKAKGPEKSDEGIGGGGFTALLIAFGAAGVILFLLQAVFGIRVW